MKTVTLSRIVGELTLEQIQEMNTDPAIGKISDFDETLAQLGHLQEEAIVRAGSQFHLTVRFDETFGANQLRSKNGWQIMEAVFDYFGRRADSATIAQATATRDNALAELVNEEANPQRFVMPGVPEFVDLMRATKQHVAIISQSPEVYIQTYLQKVGYNDVFLPELIIGATTLEAFAQFLSRSDRATPRVFTPFKPHPLSLQLARKRLERADHLPKVSYLYLGDNMIDAQTAAGMPGITCLIINSSLAKQAEIRHTFAHHGNVAVVSNLTQVLPSIR